MKRLIQSNLLLIVCAIMPTARAQGLVQTNGGYVPQGSYVQSCINGSFNSTTQVLFASCFLDKRENSGNGYPFSTSLNISFCAPGTDIENIQGNLICGAKPGTWGQGGAVPFGSYQQACVHYSVIDGNTLMANCWTFAKGKIDFSDINGLSVATLQLSQRSMSSGDIENIRGQLECTQPASSNSSPPINAVVSAPAPIVAVLVHPTPGTCKQGFVWREATPQDHVCVTSQTRQQTANDNAAAYTRTNMQSPVPQGQPHVCLQGFVWRQAVPNDFACVLPYVREQAAADNAASPSRTY